MPPWRGEESRYPAGALGILVKSGYSYRRVYRRQTIFDHSKKLSAEQIIPPVRWTSSCKAAHKPRLDKPPRSSKLVLPSQRDLFVFQKWKNVPSGAIFEPLSEGTITFQTDPHLCAGWSRAAGRDVCLRK